MRSTETKSRLQTEPPRCTHQLTYSRALGGRATTAIYLASIPPLQRALRRVHWSKEASSLGCVTPYWSTPAIKLICHWIIGTTVEAIVRRWRCPVGGNNFITDRKSVV